MLTPKEARFVSEYLIDYVGSDAAKRAGYAPRSAAVTASRLLAKPAIKAAVDAKRAQLLGSTDLTATRVLEEMRRVALSDVRTLFDTDGNLKPLHTLTADEAACIAGLEVIIKNAKAGDGVTDTIHKIKVWDKPRTLEMLAKHFGLLTEKIEHSGGLVIQHEVPV